MSDLHFCLEVVVRAFWGSVYAVGSSQENIIFAALVLVASLLWRVYSHRKEGVRAALKSTMAEALGFAAIVWGCYFLYQFCIAVPRSIRAESAKVSAPLVVWQVGIPYPSGWDTRTPILPVVINNYYTPPSRVLSDDKLVTLTNVLSQAHGMARIIPASSADDVFPLSQQICDALHRVRWGLACPTSRNSVFGREVIAKGLQCYSNDWNAKDAATFRRALKGVHLECDYHNASYDFGGIQIGGSDGVTLLIGSPAQP